MSKKFYLAALLAVGLLMPMVVTAQEVATETSVRSKDVRREYLRPSISVIYVTDGSKGAIARANELKALGMVDNDRYYYNPVVVTDSVFVPKNKHKIAKQFHTFADEILTKNRVANQVMKVWFPAFDYANKGFSMEVLEQRGHYAATDADVVKANASKRGESMIKGELGEKLIDKSYVVVHYITSTSYVKDLLKRDSKVHTKKRKSYSTYTEIYKLDFSEEARLRFYQAWDNPNAINLANVPLMHVASTGKSALTGGQRVLAWFSVKKKRKAIATVAAGLLEQRIVKVVDDFKLRTIVTGTHPVRANAGLKEALSIDKRFRVVEYVQDTATQELKEHTIGSVGVKRSVVDNRRIATGEVEGTTAFYQISGRRIEPGMTLVESPTFGVSFSLYATQKQQGATLELRPSVVFKKMRLTDFGIYLKVAGLKTTPDNIDNFQYVVGVTKHFHMARFLTISPQIGFGGSGDLAHDHYNYSTNKTKYSGRAFVEGGINVGAQLFRRLQVFGIFNVTQRFANSKEETVQMPNVTEFNFGGGLKYSF